MKGTNAKKGASNKRPPAPIAHTANLVNDFDSSMGPF
jgi:hypothetical protein